MFFVGPAFAQQASGADTTVSGPSATGEKPGVQQTESSSRDNEAQSAMPDAPSASASASQKQTNGTSRDRLFFALPNFLTVENSGNVAPLTAGQKFKATARGSFDPAQFAWYGALAGISQAKNDEPSYGQGAEGYAKRYAQSFADGTIENFMTHAIYPSVLHQDPRYYQLGSGSFGHRVTYAISRIFVTRSDSGSAEFNFSEILGSATAAGISTYSYHPREDRNLANAGNVWGTQVGYDALSDVLKEFWPDIRRKLHKSKTDEVH
jgi:hypothetical protein